MAINVERKRSEKAINVKVMIQQAIDFLREHPEGVLATVADNRPQTRVFQVMNTSTSVPRHPSTSISTSPPAPPPTASAASGSQSNGHYRSVRPTGTCGRQQPPWWSGVDVT